MRTTQTMTVICYEYPLDRHNQNTPEIFQQVCKFTSCACMGVNLDPTPRNWFNRQKKKSLIRIRISAWLSIILTDLSWSSSVPPAECRNEGLL
jgi:hypothetical protein